MIDNGELPPQKQSSEIEVLRAERDAARAALREILPTLERLKYEAECSYGSNYSQHRTERARKDYAVACAAIATKDAI